MDATINVMNASNLKTSIEVRGFTGINMERPTVLTKNAIKPRSYAFICTEKDVKGKSEHRTLFKYGEREPGDFLILYTEKNSSNGKLPLSFYDREVKITHILVRVNVRIFHFELRKLFERTQN